METIFAVSSGAPPAAIAALCKQVALEYAHHFARIVFAVVDDAAALRNGASNLEAFERAFGPARRLQPAPGAAARGSDHRAEERTH